MGHYSSLATSTSAIANEIHTLIHEHPAYKYIRTSFLYDSLYEQYKDKQDNLSLARIRTTLHIIHILDEIAHSLELIPSNAHQSIPDHIYNDAIQNPRYKAYSPNVTHESRLRQQQRLRKSTLEETKVQPSHKISSELNAFTSLIRKSKNE